MRSVRPWRFKIQAKKAKNQKNGKNIIIKKEKDDKKNISEIEKQIIKILETKVRILTPYLEKYFPIIFSYLHSITKDVNYHFFNHKQFSRFNWFIINYLGLLFLRSHSRTDLKISFLVKFCSRLTYGKVCASKKSQIR